MISLRSGRFSTHDLRSTPRKSQCLAGNLVVMAPYFGAPESSGAMAAQPEVWRTESNSLKQTVATVAALVVGLTLTIGFRDFEGPGLTNSKAGFLLGLLLLAMSIAGLLTASKYVITVDTGTRRIIVERIGRFGRTWRAIRFNEVEGVYVGQHGDREGGSISYHVLAKLKSGEVALFTGFFDGMFSKAAMEARCDRLAECLRADG